jgi:hypothetical protein
MRDINDPPPMPVRQSAFYVALCVFKDAFARSQHSNIDDRLRDALEACAPLMPQDEKA